MLNSLISTLYFAKGPVFVAYNTWGLFIESYRRGIQQWPKDPAGITKEQLCPIAAVVSFDPSKWNGYDTTHGLVSLIPKKGDSANGVHYEKFLPIRDLLKPWQYTADSSWYSTVVSYFNAQQMRGKNIYFTGHGNEEYIGGTYPQVFCKTLKDFARLNVQNLFFESCESPAKRVLQITGMKCAPYNIITPVSEKVDVISSITMPLLEKISGETGGNYDGDFYVQIQSFIELLGDTTSDNTRKIARVISRYHAATESLNGRADLVSMVPVGHDKPLNFEKVPTA